MAVSLGSKIIWFHTYIRKEKRREEKRREEKRREEKRREEKRREELRLEPTLEGYDIPEEQAQVVRFTKPSDVTSYSCPILRP